jgi:hypothetical protein
MSYSGYRTVTRKGGITVPFAGGVFLCLRLMLLET